MPKTHPFAQRILAVSFVFLALAMGLSWTPSPSRAETLSVNRLSFSPSLTPLDAVVQVGAGDSHTCALTTAGGVKCWGNNRFGQIGDGTRVWRLVPVDVVGLSSGVAAITADRGRSEGSSGHTCAATTAGGVKCWGYNRYGQLGDGATQNSVSPVDARDLPGPMVAVSACNDHTCALTTAGVAICWGSNYFGQLGDGTAWRTVPGDVLAASHVQQIFLPALER